MKVAFRADASPAIGSGHVMRCLVLADQLKRRGHEILFITGNADQAWLDYISHTRGHEVRGIGQDTDASESREILQSNFTHWLVVDHYGLDHEWEAACAPLVGKLLAIDDLANRSHACDALLDYNESHHAESYMDLVPRVCSLLLGSSHALIRPGFAARPAKTITGIHNILVNFGSYDHLRQTTKVVRAFQHAQLRNCRLLVLCGRDERLRADMAPYLEDGSIECLGFTDDMEQLLASTDLAIGAGGTSVYEKCAMGVPSIVITTADNQVEGARALHELGALHLLGEATGVGEDDLLACLLAFRDNPSGLQAISDRARSLVDGQGCRRVCDFMEGRLMLRRAGSADCELLHEWRNHEQNRRHSNQTGIIEITEHRRWFAESLHNPMRHLLLANRGGEDLAVVRLDETGPRARISIYLKPGLTGRGLGHETLLETAAWCRKFLPGLELIEAEIKPENSASLKAFAKAGFHPAGSLFELRLSAG